MLNRIDSSNLSDEIPDICQLDRKVDLNTILPSISNDKALRENIAALVSRVLVEHLGYSISCLPLKMWLNGISSTSIIGRWQKNQLW